MSTGETRLVVYGTLAPGQPNHHELAELEGHWTRGTVNGTLVRQGWGALMGYPGIILDQSGRTVDVQVFESDDLSNHWTRLDAFEGAGYRRVATQVRTSAGVIQAQIYEIAVPTGSSTQSA